jgi:PST family polysaccharide transporter
MTAIWVRYLPDLIRNRLAGRANLRKVIGNTGWLFADRILRMAIGLVVGVWIARYLGPDQFGQLNYALAFVALFGFLVSFGLDGIVVRDLVQDPARGNEILGTAFIIKLVGAFLSIGAAIVAIRLLQPSDANVHVLVAIIAAGTAFQTLDVIDFWFQARIEARYVVYARGASFVIASVVKVVMIMTNAPLIAFAWVVSLELLFSALGLVLAYRTTGQRLSLWTANQQRIRRALSDCWPIAIAGVAVVVYMRIDQVMLGQMLGNEAVGVYSAAARISEVWYFIPTAIVASVTPALIEAKKLSTTLYYVRVSQLFRLMSGIALAIAIPLTFASDYVASLLYGDAYEGVGTILAIHIWAALFVFLGVAQSPWSINEGLTRVALLRTVLGAVANVVLNLLLIPPYGPMGAAVATTISYALSAVILNAFSKSTQRIFVLQLKSMLLIVPEKIEGYEAKRPG